jgi:CheY-like chemotaxis protein
MESTSLRILLAEDDATIAYKLETCLRDAGHEVLAVEARSEVTLTASRLLQPDVVLLNTQLRGQLDGLAVASLLQAHTPSPIPVVLVTTAAEPPAAPAIAVLPMAALAGPLLAQQLHRLLFSVIAR